MQNPAEKSHTPLYVIGLILSLVLTLATYFAVVEHLLASVALKMTISALALAQFVVQLLFFLRMGQEKKPHWKLTLFLFMLIVLLVVIFGTLWIMHDLEYNAMPSKKKSYEYY